MKPLTKPEIDAAYDALEILTDARGAAFAAIQAYEIASYAWVYEGGKHPDGTLIDFLEAWRTVSNARDHVRRSIEARPMGLGAFLAMVQTDCVEGRR